MGVLVILSLLATAFLFAWFANFPKSLGITTSSRMNGEGTTASSSLAALGNTNNQSELLSLNGLQMLLVPKTPLSSVFSNSGTITSTIPHLSTFPPITSNSTVSNGTSSIINYTIGNGGPEQQNSAPEGSMWIEPSTLTFSGVNASAGTRFNVTVWLSMTKDIFAYQIAIHYDRNELQCTRAAYTGENSSQYFSGHVSDTLPIRIDTGFLGNGSVLAGETLYDNDMIQGPRNASLIWIEFEILKAPSGQTSAGKLDLSTEYPAETFALDNNLENVPFTPEDATYSFTS
jgi:hypothetical protein